MNKMKRRSLSKIIVGVVSLALTINTFMPTIAMASPVSYTSEPMVYASVLRGINNIEGLTTNKTQKAYIQIADLINIEQEVIWYSYMTTNKGISYPTASIDKLATNIKDKVTVYNSAYGNSADVKGDCYKASLDVDLSSQASMENLVNSQIANIIGNIISPLQSKYTTLKDTSGNYEAFQVFKYAYGAVLQSTGTVTYINEHIGNTNWTFDTKGISELQNQYKVAMAIGKQIIATTFAKQQNNELSESDFLFNQFTEINNQVKNPLTANRVVNNAYWSVVASTAGYRPLVDKDGGQIQTNALKSINSNADVLTSAGYVQDYKKPIYFRTFLNGSATKYTGSYKMVTLMQLEEDLKSHTYGSFYLPKGQILQPTGNHDPYKFVTTINVVNGADLTEVKTPGDTSSNNNNTGNNKTDSNSKDNNTVISTGVKPGPGPDTPLGPSTNPNNSNNNNTTGPVVGNGPTTPPTVSGAIKVNHILLADPKTTTAPKVTTLQLNLDKGKTTGTVVDGVTKQTIDVTYDKDVLKTITVKDKDGKAQALKDIPNLDLNITMPSGTKYDIKVLSNGTVQGNMIPTTGTESAIAVSPSGAVSEVTTTSPKTTNTNPTVSIVESSTNMKGNVCTYTDTSSGITYTVTQDSTGVIQSITAKDSKGTAVPLKNINIDVTETNGITFNATIGSDGTGTAVETTKDKKTINYKVDASGNFTASTTTTKTSKDNTNSNTPSPQGQLKATNTTPVVSANSPYQTATASISNSNAFMDFPVFGFGTNAPYNTLGLLLLTNIINSIPYTKLSSTAKNSYLYMDPFGNIVLSNNTIVIPAASNPLLLAGSRNYYVGTAGFTSVYPKTTVSSETFHTLNSAQVGKMALAFPNAQGESGKLGNSLDGYAGTSVVGISSSTSISDIGVYKASLPINYAVTTDSGIKENILNFKKFPKTSSTENLDIFLVNEGLVAGGNNQYTVFPVSISNQNGANYLASEMYSLLLSPYNGQTSATGNYFNITKMTDILYECLQGTQSPQAFQSNIEAANGGLNTQVFGVFQNAISNTLTVIQNSLGGITGVLGIKSAFSQPGFGTFVYYVTYLWKYIIVIIFMIYTFRYLSGNRGISVALLSATGAVIVFFAFTCVIPQYVPKVYNYVGQKFDNAIVYSTMMLNQDTFSNPLVKSKGELGFVNGSPSMNVYDVPQPYMNIALSNLNMTKAQMYSGVPYIQDEKSGFYVQGGLLKYNVEALLNTYTIIDNNNSFDTMGNKVTRVDLTKNTSTNMDYYSGYSLMLQSFIGNLNKFSTAYRLTPQSLSYKGGALVKGAFVVNDYLSSNVFLNPGKVVSDYGSPSATASQLIIYKNFKNPYDWLGLNQFWQNASEYKGSLWYNTLMANHMTDVNSPVVQQIIKNVNSETKSFVESIYPEKNYISDSTLIKIISLYATMQLDKEISSPGLEVYPQKVNSQDLSLQSVLQGTLVNMSSKYMATKGAFSKYIVNQYGMFGAILIICIYIAAWLCTVLFKLLIPLLYVILLIIWILKSLFFGQFDTQVGKSVISNLTDSLKGYIKSGILIWGCYTAFIFSTCFARNFSGSNIALIILLVVYLFILKILFSLIFMIFTKDAIWDLGNKKISNKYNDMLQGMGIQSSFLDKMQRGIDRAYQSGTSKFTSNSNIDVPTYNYNTSNYGNSDMDSMPGDDRVYGQSFSQKAANKVKDSILEKRSREDFERTYGTYYSDNENDLFEDMDYTDDIIDAETKGHVQDEIGDIKDENFDDI